MLKRKCYAILSLLAGLIILNTTGNAWGAPGDLRWAFEANGRVYSAPAMADDGTIYVGSGGLDGHLYAINPDGSQKWAYDMDNTSVRMTPAIAPDGTIYINGESGLYLYAIKPDGTGYKWRHVSFPECSPAIGVDGTVYISNNTRNMYWLNKQTGFRTCSHSTEDTIDASPSIAQNGRIYFGNDAGYLHAVGPGCTSHWHFYIGGAVKSSPAICSDGTIYVGSRNGKLYAINPDGSQKWNFTTGGAINSSPAIGPDGTIYVGSDDNLLYAINPDGTQKWAYATDGEVRSSPAIGADNTVYVGSYDHCLHAINGDGSQKWKYQTEDLIDSSPAIGADGTVYVGSFDHKLYAIEGASGGLAQSAWPMFRQNLKRTGFGGSNQPPFSDLTGTWNFSESNMQDSCSTPDPAETGQVTISIGIDSYTIIGDQTYEGGFYDDTFFFTSVDTINGGTTRNFGTIIFTSNQTAEGSIDWRWTSDSGSLACKGGHDVALTKASDTSITPDNDDVGGGSDGGGGGGGGCFLSIVIR